MEKEDVELMEVALKSIYHICKENNGEGCNDCPANGLGKLCHHGRISCCAPHGWWGFKEIENEQVEMMLIDRPCPKCGGDNIRFDLTATANGFAIGAQCKDCAQEFVLKHREAIRKMWNEGYFEEASDE